MPAAFYGPWPGEQSPLTPGPDGVYRMIALWELLWPIGGAGVTAVLAIALAYWIIQESLARDPRHLSDRLPSERPAASDGTGEGSADADQQEPR